MGRIRWDDLQKVPHTVPDTGSCWLSTVAIENVNVGREWWEGHFEESTVLTHLKIIPWKRSVSGLVVFEEILMFSFVLVCFFNWKKMILYYSSVLSPILWHIYFLKMLLTEVQLNISRASLVAQMVKNLPAMQETKVWSLDQEDVMEKGMATHSSILAWWIPWTEEPGLL